MSSFVTVTLPDGQRLVWPNPRDPKEVQWHLRYGSPTRGDLLVAAAFIETYRQLFELPPKLRNQRMQEVKAVLADEINPLESREDKTP